MAHSLGPWVWQGLHRDGEAVLYACGGEKHRLVKAASEPRLSDADAALIAASPELAALLRKVTAKLRDYMENADDHDQEMLEHTGVLDAEALLKRIDATGDQS